MKLTCWRPEQAKSLDPYKAFVKVYSYSQIEAFRRCEAFYRHNYVRRVELRKRPSYYVWGEAYHFFLEVWYGSRNMDLAMKAINDVFMKQDLGLATAKEVENMRIQQAQVEGVAEAYPTIYAEDDFVEVLPEQWIILEVKGAARPIAFQGHIDMLVRDREDKWWVFETKTASYGTVNSDYYSSLGFDGQVIGYTMLAEIGLGIRPHGVLYNVIQKPTIRPKKRPTPETLPEFRQRVKDEYVVNTQGKEYMVRYPFLVPDYTKKEWETDVLHTMELLDRKWAQESRVWPKTTSACRSKYGLCMYVDACNAGACSDPRKYGKIRYRKKPPRK